MERKRFLKLLGRSRVYNSKGKYLGKLWWVNFKRKIKNLWRTK